jgi:hypothetical protein
MWISILLGVERNVIKLKTLRKVFELIKIIGLNDE